MQQKASFLNSVITIVFVFTNLLVLGQSTIDSSKKTVTEEGQDQTFTRAEIMPAFEQGYQALADTLKKQLPESLLHISKREFYFTLLIAKSGEVIDVIPKTDLRIPNQLAAALKHTRWIAARQNEHLVKCYKPILIVLGKGKLEVVELPLPPPQSGLKQPGQINQ